MAAMVGGFSVSAAAGRAVDAHQPCRTRPAQASSLRGMKAFSGLRASPECFAKPSVNLVDKVRAQLAVGGGRGKKHVTTCMPIGVPKVPYKTPNEAGWQWVDIWNCMYRERIIWVGQTIDEELGNQLIGTLLFLDSIEKGKDIMLYINSEGGEVVPTLAILDTMKHLTADVGAIAFGSARAMGGMLLACGVKGKRAALPNTCIMLHHPSGAARGSASDIFNEGRELLKIREHINKTIAKATGHSPEKVHNDIRRDKHMTAEDALEYGVIDKVLYRTKVRA